MKEVSEKAKRSKRLSPDERRLQLLTCAIETFTRHGVDGTTMHQLAENACVSYGLFYHYFNSKEQVLLEAVNQLSVVTQIEEFLSQHDQPLDAHLIAFSKLYEQVMEEGKESYFLLFSESRKRKALAERLSAMAHRFRAAMIRYLSARQQVGEISSDTDLDVATRVIFSYLFMRLLWIEDEPPIEEHMRVILLGVLGRESTS